MALDLDAIEARANAAPAGPWFANDYYGDFILARGMGAFAEWLFDGGSDESPAATTSEATARFIAAAREDVPSLVDEVRRLQRENMEAKYAHRVALDRARGFEAELTRLRSTPTSASQCYHCQEGQHDCKEEGGGRGWVEFECLCEKCPVPTRVP